MKHNATSSDPTRSRTTGTWQDSGWAVEDLVSNSEDEDLGMGCDSFGQQL
jgi:hypothetical protein